MKYHKKHLLIPLILITLTSTFENTGQAEDNPDRDVELLKSIDWSRKQGVINVGPIVYLNTDTTDPPLWIRESLIRHLRLDDTVLVAPTNRALDALLPTLEQKALPSIVITGSVKSVTSYQVPFGIVFEATASIVVMDYPDRSMRSVITQTARITRSLSEYRVGEETHLTTKVIQNSMRLVALSLADLLHRKP